MAFVEPVKLEARGVRLVPLGLEHEAGLAAAAADGELWNLRITSVPTPDQTAYTTLRPSRLMIRVFSANDRP